MLTKNFYAAMRTALGETTSVGTTLSGVAANVGYASDYWYGTFTSMNNYNNSAASQYVEFGNGTTPATVGDYKLESQITSGITVTYPNAVTTEQTDSYISWTVTFGVKASVETTISEIGLVSKLRLSTGNSFDYFLIDRTVLDTPITIPAGLSKQITYTIRFNY